MTLRIETQSIADVKAGAWDAWMARHGAADYQHYYGYGAALSGPATTAHFMRFLDESDEVGRGLLLEQKFGPLKLLYCPRGVVLAQAAAAQRVYHALRTLAQGWRGRFLLLSPTMDMAHAMEGAKPVISGECEALLDLRGSADGVIQGMQQKWRNRLHKAQSHNVEVTIAGPKEDGAQWIEEQERCQRNRKGYRALRADLPRVMALAKGKTQAMCVMARSSGCYVAAANFILFGQTAFYFSGITTPNGRDLCAQHLVLFNAALTLGDQGYKTLNLGVVDTHKAPGLARFKFGLGAKKYTRMGTFLLS